MDKTRIRRCVCNLTLNQWHQFDKKAKGFDYIDITVDEWIKEIGVRGGNFFSAKINDKEKVFIDLLYSKSRISTAG